MGMPLLTTLSILDKSLGEGSEMARGPGLDAQGAYIMSSFRGIERKAIFRMFIIPFGAEEGCWRKALSSGIPSKIT
ncbi:MAG: hypothetical protein A2156_06840 [Deltaproteobacteria bacterium RBG_16_48_10]|nr:MAG: hypothetical protein A2156_06840 [Deltaproteobacteria bacterium RBG_16_48_10]